MHNMTTKLVYIPSTTVDYETDQVEVVWKLYVVDGPRFTPNMLTNTELIQHQRNMRDIQHPGLQTAYQYHNHR